jgi:hypothetical protein
LRIEKFNNIKPNYFGPEHFEVAWFYSIIVLQVTAACSMVGGIPLFWRNILPSSEQRAGGTHLPHYAVELLAAFLLLSNGTFWNILKLHISVELKIL